MTHRIRVFPRAAAIAVSLAACARVTSAPSNPNITPVERSPAVLMQQVEVRRTAHGVPHILAQNLAAAGYAEAYVQSEDYGARVALSLLHVRGQVAKWYGHDSIAQDFNDYEAYK